MPSGGPGRGGGRKPLHEEIKARDLAVKAIVSKFGSLESGLEFLLGTEEPTLVKFVFEHAIGKPKEKLEHSGELLTTNVQLTKDEVKEYAAILNKEI